MLNLYEELKSWVAQLNAAGVEYALCGGLGLALHGFARATMGMDFLIRRESLPRVEDLARKLDYKIKANPMTFARESVEIHRISKADSEDGDLLPLDLLLVAPEIEEV